MVDAADHEKVETAKQELQGLLAKPQLSGIPVTILFLNTNCFVMIFLVFKDS